MDVLVCATSVPFGPNGPSPLVSDTVAAFRAAGHRCDAVLLPAASEQERVLDAALAWRMVPLDADVVVAVDFPAYFARHPRKVVWLDQPLRTAADSPGEEGSGFTPDDSGLEIHRQLVDWDTRTLGEAIGRHATSAAVASSLGRSCGLDAAVLARPPSEDAEQWASVVSTLLGGRPT